MALSALVRVPEERQVWLGAEALRRITEAPLSEQQRYLLGERVESYLRLDESQWRNVAVLRGESAIRGSLTCKRCE